MGVELREVDRMFEVGERVLCFEPDPNKFQLIYDAKVINIEWNAEMGDTMYKVHFHGWNSTWDRFVTRDFLLQETEANRAHQRALVSDMEEALRLRKQKKSKQEKKTNTTTPNTSSTTKTTVNTTKLITTTTKVNMTSKNDGSQVIASTVKRKKSSSSTSSSVVSSTLPSESSLTLEESSQIRVAKRPRLITFEFSSNLKERLLHDQYRLKQECRPYSLPLSCTIEVIFEMFVESKSASIKTNIESKASKEEKREDIFKRIQSEIDILRQGVEGLRIMLDFYLPTCLLYQCERQQYDEVMSGPPTPYVPSSSDLRWHLLGPNAKRPLPCTVYSVFHLLRLLVKLPDIVARMNDMEATKMSVLNDITIKLIAFIDENDHFFNVN